MKHLPIISEAGDRAIVQASVVELPVTNDTPENAQFASALGFLLPYIMRISKVACVGFSQEILEMMAPGSSYVQPQDVVGNRQILRYGLGRLLDSDDLYNQLRERELTTKQNRTQQQSITRGAEGEYYATTYGLKDALPFTGPLASGYGEEANKAREILRDQTLNILGTGASVVLMSKESRKKVVAYFGERYFEMDRPYHKRVMPTKKFSEYMSQNLTGGDFTTMIEKILEDQTVTDYFLQEVGLGFPSKIADTAKWIVKWIDDNFGGFMLVSQPVKASDAGSNRAFSFQFNSEEDGLPTNDMIFNLSDIRGKEGVAFGSAVNSSIANVYNPKLRSVIGEMTPEDYFIDLAMSERYCTIIPCIRVPKEAALYLSQSDTDEVDELSLVDNLRADWDSATAANFYDKRGKPALPLGAYGLLGGTPPLSRLVEAREKLPMKPNSGVAKSGLCVTEDGAILYVPTAHNSVVNYEEQRAAYLASVNSNLADDEEPMLFVDDPLAIPRNNAVVGKGIEERPRPELEGGLSNRNLYVDWRLGVYVTTNSSGLPIIGLDLSTVRPLQSRHLIPFSGALFLQMANSQPPHFQHNITEVLAPALTGEYVPQIDPTAWATFIREWVTRAFTFSIKEGDEELTRIDEGTINRYVSSLPSKPFPTMWNSLEDSSTIIAQRRIDIVMRAQSELDGKPVEEADISGIHDDYLTLAASHQLDSEWFKLRSLDLNSPCLLTACATFMIDFVWKSISKRFDDLLRSKAFLTALQEYGTFKVVQSTIGKLPVMIAEFAAGIRDTDEAPPADYIPDALAGGREGYALLPHQVRADYHMASLDKNGLPADLFILNAQAGAGKTHLVAVHVIRYLNSGYIRRPLIIMPSYLHKNYIEDVAYISEGRYNVIPLDTAIRNYSPKQGDSRALGLEGLRTMIENAPPNTIFLTSFTFTSVRSSSRVFQIVGFSDVLVNPVVDMLLDCNFDYVCADESHILRNRTSGMYQAARTLFYRTKYAGLATGTFINTRPEDIPSQMSLLNPTLFGTPDDFVERYAESTTQMGRIDRLDPRYRDELTGLLKMTGCYVSIKRKEWASLLPARKDIYHSIALPIDGPHWIFYQAVLTQVLTAVRELLAQNKSAAKAAAEGDEEESLNVEALLRPFLQRLEMAVLTPRLDKDFDRLTDELGIDDADWESPKIERCIQILRRHLQGMSVQDAIAMNENAGGANSIVQITEDMETSGIVPPLQGKVLVFCNYNTTVDAIYEALPPDLKAMAIRYDASKKDEHIFQFKNNPEKKILIGIQTSLSTGHNLQLATRLIRMEQVWAPGEVEQGESRINRPDPKNADKERGVLYFDWVFANGTIDVSKMSRLTSRMLLNIMIEENGNPRYEKVGQLPLITMNLECIEKYCWLVSPDEAATGQPSPYSLRRYLAKKREVDIIQQQEFDEFRQNYKGRMTPAEVPAAPMTLEGSAIIANVPPIPGQYTANADKFGIINVASYMNTLGTQDPAELIGLPAYTPEGDGTIIGSRGRNLVVQIGSEKFSFNQLSISVYTDSRYTRKDVLAASGLTKVVDIAGNDITAQTLGGKSAKPKKVKTDEGVVDVVVDPQPTPKKTQPTVDPDDGTVVDTNTGKKSRPSPVPDQTSPALDGKIEISAGTTNGALCLYINGEDADAKANVKFLKDMGFVRTPGYYFISVKTWKHFDTFLRVIEEKFEVNAKSFELVESFEESFRGGKSKRFDAEHATQREIIEYFRVKYRTLGPREVILVPCVEEGEFFIMIDTRHQAANKVIQEVRVPGCVWEQTDPAWVKLYGKKQAVADDAKELKSRFDITNLAEVREMLQKIRITNPGNAKKSEESRRS